MKDSISVKYLANILNYHRNTNFGCQKAHFVLYILFIFNKTSWSTGKIVSVNEKPYFCRHSSI